jgi:flagellar hook-associated protein 3 FlgL
MRVSNSIISQSFLNEVTQLEQQQNTLQTQASTGLKVTSPEDNPVVMTDVLTQQTENAANTSYQNNIALLQRQATTVGSAMNSLQTLTSQASEIAVNASSSTTSPTQLTAYASQIKALIQQAVAIANTQDANGNYIFSGTATNTKPFATTSNANGDITAVTYQGNTSVANSDIAPNSTVTAQVPGENNTGSGPQGLFADSRTGANLFNNLLTLQQDLTSGNTSAIASTDAPALTTDDDHIINQISANGVMQSALTAAGNRATALATTIATTVSSETNADLAQTMTELDQTQTAFQAALESGTKIMSVSLLNFLG